MNEWLFANSGTIIVTLILVVIVALVVLKLVRDKKSGKHSCGCNCAHCALAGSCHNKK